jgi:hypothetical protein
MIFSENRYPLFGIMLNDGRRMRILSATFISTRGAAMMAAALLVSGCSYTDGWFSSRPTAQAPSQPANVSDRMGAFFFGPPAQDIVATGVPAEVDCPGVDIRQGASTLGISTPGAEATPMNTRYQVSIGQTARECASLGGVMTMKVGVQGRVLLGPAGSPGRVDVPLRVAVVEEGANPKPIVSKFYRVAVDVPPGQTSVPFMHVEQDLTFPLPRSGALDNYVVYVGFDPGGAPARPERKKKR